MGENKLQAISQLIGVQFAASQAKLRNLIQREARLNALLAELDLQKRDVTLTAEGTKDSILDFQNDIRMKRWVDQRRVSVNTELAQVKALINIQQSDVSRHFSRQNALLKVVAQEQQLISQARQRRLDYGT